MHTVPRLNSNGSTRFLENTSDGRVAIENRTRYRAQSILTVDGEAGPLLPMHQAADVCRWHDRHLQQQARNRTGWGYAAHVPAHMRRRMLFTSGHAQPTTLEADARRYALAPT